MFYNCEGKNIGIAKIPKTNILTFAKGSIALETKATAIRYFAGKFLTESYFSHIIEVGGNTNNFGGRVISSVICSFETNKLLKFKIEDLTNNLGVNYIFPARGTFIDSTYKLPICRTFKGYQYEYAQDDNNEKVDTSIYVTIINNTIKEIALVAQIGSNRNATLNADLRITLMGE